MNDKKETSIEGYLILVISVVVVLTISIICVNKFVHRSDSSENQGIDISNTSTISDIPNGVGTPTDAKITLSTKELIDTVSDNMGKYSTIKSNTYTYVNDIRVSKSIVSMDYKNLTCSAYQTVDVKALVEDMGVDASYEDDYVDTYYAFIDSKNKIYKWSENKEDWINGYETPCESIDINEWDISKLERNMNLLEMFSYIDIDNVSYEEQDGIITIDEGITQTEDDKSTSYDWVIKIDSNTLLPISIQLDVSINTSYSTILFEYCDFSNKEITDYQ